MVFFVRLFSITRMIRYNAAQCRAKGGPNAVWVVGEQARESCTPLITGRTQTTPTRVTTKISFLFDSERAPGMGLPAEPGTRRAIISRAHQKMPKYSEADCPLGYDQLS